MSTDGMSYAPKGKPNPVVKPGEFVFAATALEHGHVYGQCNGLIEAGGELRWVYDPDPAKVAAFQKAHPNVKVARDLDEILADADVRMVAAAAIPCDRGPLGVRCMKAGKDYFTDKTPFTSLEQVEEARKTAAETGQRYMVYYSERLHVECAVFAGDLVNDGVIGKVVQVLGLGPHRLNAPSRPEWFFKKAQYGGILNDIGSHQIEQYLFFAGAKDARVTSARIANTANPEYPELDDYGEATLVSDNGVSSFYRVDWLTPEGLGTWGDGRTIILGTKGYIELRKYIDPASSKAGNHLIIVDGKGEQHLELQGKVGYPFFGKLILDSLNRTEHAMTQEHAFKAAELCIKCQLVAEGKLAPESPL